MHDLVLHNSFDVWPRVLSMWTFRTRNRRSNEHVTLAPMLHGLPALIDGDSGDFCTSRAISGIGASLLGIRGWRCASGFKYTMPKLKTSCKGPVDLPGD